MLERLACTDRTHELSFRSTVPRTSDQPTLPGKPDDEFNQQLRASDYREKAGQDYRKKYTEEFDKEAEQQLGVQEK